MNTQDGSGLWGYHDNAKSLCCQKPVDIKKKVDAKNYLIFKYVVENTRLKKVIPNLYRQTNFFRDRATRRDLNLYRKFMEHVIVVYTLNGFSIWRWQPFWAAILNLKFKTDPKYNEYHSINLQSQN